MTVDSRRSVLRRQTEKPFTFFCVQGLCVFPHLPDGPFLLSSSFAATVWAHGFVRSIQRTTSENGMLYVQGAPKRRRVNCTPICRQHARTSIVFTSIVYSRRAGFGATFKAYVLQAIFRASCSQSDMQAFQNVQCPGGSLNFINFAQVMEFNQHPPSTTQAGDGGDAVEWMV